MLIYKNMETNKKLEETSIGTEGGEVKGKKIEVDKKALNSLIARLESLENDNKLLKDVADKGRMEWAESKQSKPIKRTVKLTTIDDKIVVGWKTIKDVVEKNPTTGVWNERQEYEFIFEDESTYPVIGYNKFADLQYSNQIVCEVVSKTDDGEGNIVFKVKLPQGRILDIDHRFVN